MYAESTGKTFSNATLSCFKGGGGIVITAILQRCKSSVITIDAQNYFYTFKRKNGICFSVSASRYVMTELMLDSQVLMVSPLHGF